MASAFMSPSSVLATPIQVNPQVVTDLQTSMPQVSQDAQKVAKAEKTDTITISAQALKMADSKDIDSKAADKKAREQETANSEAVSAKNDAQRSAVKAYASVEAMQ
ncbi:MAG: hypothetical protein PHY09_06260 [Desulfuromonadaceae bacterium]|nr:hypothetical protein [Desulfuromonadaceae bacterium]MDD5107107.1 hypothetical protein [Desulfuromonadaceae bacterium]